MATHSLTLQTWQLSALRDNRLKLVVVRLDVPSVEAVRKLSGSDYGWMPPDGYHTRWRVSGPVWAVRELMGREPLLKLPYAVGDVVRLVQMPDLTICGQPATEGYTHGTARVTSIDVRRVRDAAEDQAMDCGFKPEMRDDEYTYFGPFSDQWLANPGASLDDWCVMIGLDVEVSK